MPVELPGFRTVIPNSVYERDGTLVTNHAESPCLRIVTAGRFLEPTENEVAEYTCRTIVDYYLKGSKPKPYTFHDLVVSAAIYSLNPRFVNDIRKGKKGAVRYVTDMTPPRRLEEGESPAERIRVVSGILPSIIVEANRNIGAANNVLWYEYAMASERMKGQDIGLRWTALLKLHEFPPWQECCAILRNGMHEGRTLGIMPSDYSSEELLDVMSAFYSGFENSLVDLPDIRDTVLDLYVKTTIERIASEQSCSQTVNPFQIPADFGNSKILLN